MASEEAEWPVDAERAFAADTAGEEVRCREEEHTADAETGAVDLIKGVLI
jgi:hypothetical protein